MTATAAPRRTGREGECTTAARACGLCENGVREPREKNVWRRLCKCAEMQHCSSAADAGGPKHAGKYDEQVSLRAVLRIEAALRPHARLYD